MKVPFEHQVEIQGLTQKIRIFVPKWSTSQDFCSVGTDGMIEAKVDINFY